MGVEEREEEREVVHCYYSRRFHETPVTTFGSSDQGVVVDPSSLPRRSFSDLGQSANLRKLWREACKCRAHTASNNGTGSYTTSPYDQKQQILNISFDSTDPSPLRDKQLQQRQQQQQHTDHLSDSSSKRSYDDKYMVDLCSGHPHHHHHYQRRALVIIPHYHIGEEVQQVEAAGAGRPDRITDNGRSWSLRLDPEVKRKSRLAGYNAIALEAKVKSSMRKSLRWIKNKYLGMLQR